jgi:hypothetical protein
MVSRKGQTLDEFFVGQHPNLILIEGDPLCAQ